MRKALFTILGLSVLVDLALGAWASVTWDSFVNSWLPDLMPLVGAQALEVRLLGLVLGLCLLCYAAIQILAIKWIRDEKEEGLNLAILFGGYLIVSSVITFLLFQSHWEFLLVDGVRGAVLTVFAVVVRNAPSTIRVLRLPEGRRREQREGRRPAGRRDESRGRRAPARSSGQGDRRRSPKVARKPAEQPAQEEGKRPPRSRRKRGGRSTQGPRPEPENGREHLRPVVTSKTSQTEGRTSDRQRVQSDSRASRGPEGSRRAEASASADAGSRVQNRPRTTEELLADEVASYRRRPASGPDSSLAVVVRGDLGDSNEPSAEASQERDGRQVDSEGRAESGAEDRGAGRKGRRRRRRPRDRKERSEQSGFDSETPDSEPRQDSTPVSGANREDSERRDTPKGPAIVEALDMLSMLEPVDDDSDSSSPEYGRGRRPSRRQSARRR